MSYSPRSGSTPSILTGRNGGLQRELVAKIRLITSVGSVNDEHKFQLDQPCPLVYSRKSNMSKSKNILGWLVKSLLVFAFLIVIVIVFTPGWINLQMVKDTIKEKISTEVGGRITYHKLRLSYFPRPHVVIQKAQISIPDNFTIDIEWIRAYPKLLPLFKGKFEFAVVRLDYADCSIKLPQIKGAPGRQREKIPSYDDMVNAFAEAVRDLLQFELPDLNLRIKNGRVNFVDPFGSIFMLREVQAAYIGGKETLDFSVNCRSNLWEQININGSLDPSDFKGAGHVNLSRFRPQTLIAYLFPESAIQVTETRANVTIDFTSDGDGKIKAEVGGAIPFFRIVKQRREAGYQGQSDKGHSGGRQGKDPGLFERIRGRRTQTHLGRNVGI